MPTLLDGSEVASDSEAWRHECEARAILSIQGIERRRNILAMIQKHRGEPERVRLEKTIMALWRQRKQNAETKPAA